METRRPCQEGDREEDTELTVETGSNRNDRRAPLSDDRDFEEFYRQHATGLKRLALAVTSDPGEADDLVQEALLRTYRFWPLIRAGSPGPYVRRTLINLHRTSLRRKAVERKHLGAMREELTPSHDHRVELAITVAAGLRHLPPIRRITILLRFYYDLSQADIARLLNRPIGTVKSDLHRALWRLRPLFEEHGPATSPSRKESLCLHRHPSVQSTA